MNWISCRNMLKNFFYLCYAEIVIYFLDVSLVNVTLNLMNYQNISFFE